MKGKVKKAHELTDAEISFVSLVDKAANKKTFLITKAEDGIVNWESSSRIIKTDNDTHHVTGIVYEPNTEDTQGEFMTEEEIAKACYWFAKNGNDVDVQHSFKSQEGVSIVENWVAKADFTIGDETIKKGTWLITAEVQNDDIWDKITKGEITGFSMGGRAKHSSEDVDLDTLSKSDADEDKGSLLSRIAKALGFKVVTKGKVAEMYENMTKNSCFWNAFTALQECLYNYNWSTGDVAYESDELVIREALSEFSSIITDVLAMESVTKSIKPPIDSLAKSEDGKQTISGIYNSFSEFLEDVKKSLNNDAKEESEMTKAEIEKLVADAVTKAMEGAKTPEPQLEVQKNEEPEITPEYIGKAVDEAVKKALEAKEPKQEAVTADQIQKMISDAVEKAVEPIRKQTGLPSNLNGDDSVTKKSEETHYLHGIL